MKFPHQGAASCARFAIAYRTSQAGAFGPWVDTDRATRVESFHRSTRACGDERVNRSLMPIA